MKRFQRFSSGKITDPNHIHASQVQTFLSDLLENHKQAVYYHLNVMGVSEDQKSSIPLTNDITAAFKKLRIQVKQNTIDRKNLFLGGVPGNAIGIPPELYVPMASDMAASLVYFEGGYSEATSSNESFRLVDRITGRPLHVSVYQEPEKKHWIFNRGMLVASGSGGGKSYWTNHYIASELRTGGEAIIMEDGHSYDKLTAIYDGVVLEHSDERPFTFNPFLLDPYDVQVSDLGHRRLSEDKLLHLVTLFQLISNEDRTSTGNDVGTTILEHLIIGYYEFQWQLDAPEFKFDTFYEFSKSELFSLLKTHDISHDVFDPHVFLFLLQKYYRSGVRGNLLNQTDSRLQGLSTRKLVYFKMGGLIDNALLFPITALMVMDLFNKKMHDPKKLAMNKILAVDEAWKALDRPELAHYFNAQSRMARKLGGQPIFISQKVDDFIASEIIRDAIVVNSHIKVFLDMRDFRVSFDRIQSLLGLGEKQKQLILSLNKDIPEDRSFREVAICWMDRVKVYGVETSLEERCIYETSPKDCDIIEELHEQHQKHWPLTTKAYAFHKSKNTSK
jgi:conjugation system TraG family ATPase